MMGESNEKFVIYNKDIYNTSDGAFVLTYPNELTLENFNDIKAFIELWLKSKERRVLKHLTASEEAKGE